MPIQLECPGCKATLQVPDELAGKQGKCIQCGHRLTVPTERANPGSFPIPASETKPMASPATTTPPAAAKAAGTAVPPPSPPSKFSGGISPPLFEAAPESMVRELFSRQQSAMLLVFPTPQDGSYDLSKVPDAELKCIATEDINQPRFAQLVESFIRRFAPRRRGQSATGPTTEELLYELKGDRLGMTLDEFKEKYARSVGGQRLPLCSDTSWGANRASLHSEPWHAKAGILHARTDLPSEDNSPTVAGVKTELLLYQFVDGKLFRIAASFATDQFHVVSEAATKKYGDPSNETNKPRRQLVWENSIAWVSLTRGTVHPREASVLELVHRQLHELAVSRTPTAAADI